MKRGRRDKGETRVESDLRWDGGLCFRRRPVISNQLWLTDSGGKFLAVNAACHSGGAAVSSWESGDEGRINWHSGGERWRESEGDPVDGHTLSPSIHHSFLSVNIDTICVPVGVRKAGGSDGSLILGVTCKSYVKLHVLKMNQHLLLTWHHHFSLKGLLASRGLLLLGSQDISFQLYNYKGLKNSG